MLQGRVFAGLADAQRLFDPWRTVYNTQRPHQALEMATPASRYRRSERVYQPNPAAAEYAPGAITRKVRDGGRLQYQGQAWRIGSAFDGEVVAVCPSQEDGHDDVLWHSHRIARINRHQGTVQAGRRLD